MSPSESNPNQMDAHEDGRVSPESIYELAPLPPCIRRPASSQSVEQGRPGTPRIPQVPRARTPIGEQVPDTCHVHRREGARISRSNHRRNSYHRDSHVAVLSPRRVTFDDRRAGPILYMQARDGSDCTVDNILWTAYEELYKVENIAWDSFRRRHPNVCPADFVAMAFFLEKVLEGMESDDERWNQCFMQRASRAVHRAYHLHPGGPLEQTLISRQWYDSPPPRYEERDPLRPTRARFGRDASMDVYIGGVAYRSRRHT